MGALKIDLKSTGEGYPVGQYREKRLLWVREAICPQCRGRRCRDIAVV